MRQQNRKGNFNKHTNNAYGYGNPNEYEHYKVEKPAPLLEWLMENVKGPSKTKVKQTLQGRGIKVNGKTITQFDYALKPGMKVSVSKCVIFSRSVASTFVFNIFSSIVTSCVNLNFPNSTKTFVMASLNSFIW